MLLLLMSKQFKGALATYEAILKVQSLLLHVSYLIGPAD